MDVLGKVADYGRAEIQCPAYKFEMQRSGFKNHLQRMIGSGFAECVVCLQNVLEFEAVRDQAHGIDPPGLDCPQQHRRRYRIHKPGPERDVMAPQPLQVQVHFHAMHAQNRYISTRSDDAFANAVGCRNANRLDRCIHATAVGQLHHFFDSFAIDAMDSVRGPNFFATSSRLLSRSIMMMRAGE